MTVTSEDRLAAWLATQISGDEDIRVEGLDRVEFGHSAETLLLTIGIGDESRDVVVRVRPPAPGLLEPYDFQRQFDILRAVETTPVRAPRALWLEPTGEVLGREFYVMERLPGTVYERHVPPELAVDPARIRRMSEAIVEQIAAIHTVDVASGGFDGFGDGRDYVDRELTHWSNEIERVRSGPLPGLARLVSELGDQRPPANPQVTLVHGDPKPGNFAFVGAEVSAVFDWELATLGDPLADIGWAETLWLTPNAITAVPDALTVDEMVARWEELTGFSSAHRSWYRAFQGLKMAVILLVGGSLYGSRHSDDPRLQQMTYAIPNLTRGALRDLGVEDKFEPGAITPEMRPAPDHTKPVDKETEKG